MVIEFPERPEVKKALARITEILQAFLPLPAGSPDSRLRRLPVVEVWQPQGTEAEQLAGLGGLLAPETRTRLSQQLTSWVQKTGEEVLVSVLIPPIEESQTPARLVALTRPAFLVFDEKRQAHAQRPGGERDAIQMQRYALSTISSAQLSYSILGAGLSLFVPKSKGTCQRYYFPFHSPALASFLPLFTRLRIALSGPYTDEHITHSGKDLP